MSEKFSVFGIAPLCLIGLLNVAHAESENEAKSAPVESDEIKAVSADTADEAEVKDTPQVEEVAEVVPDNEKAERSRENIARMKEILTRVLKHLEDAREERDVVKLNCVNEKLTAIKGLLKISEQADVAMQEALARRNSEVATHEYDKTSIAVSKCEELFSESEACVGELAVYSGETQLEVEIEGEPPTDLTEEDTTIEPITRPAAASPYQ